jgi:hypothetical protein
MSVALRPALSQFHAAVAIGCLSKRPTAARVPLGSDHNNVPIAGKAKRPIGEVLGDETLHDKGNTQERRGREERHEPADIKPFANLNKLN